MYATKIKVCIVQEALGALPTGIFRGHLSIVPHKGDLVQHAGKTLEVTKVTHAIWTEGDDVHQGVTVSVIEVR